MKGKSKLIQPEDSNGPEIAILYFLFTFMKSNVRYLNDAELLILHATFIRSIMHPLVQVEP